MTGRRWVSMVAFVYFAWAGVAFPAPAGATMPEGTAASTDSAGTKKSDSGKTTAKPKAKKRRQPVNEGDQDEHGVIYTK